MFELSFPAFADNSNFVDMERSNIISAPRCDNINMLFKQWNKSHSGNMDSFLKFMSHPSAERLRFISTCRSVILTKGDVISISVG